MTQPKQIKCPWCGKSAPVKKQRLASHLNYGQQKCVGIGQRIEQVIAINKLRQEIRT